MMTSDILRSFPRKRESSPGAGPKELGPRLRGDERKFEPYHLPVNTGLRFAMKAVRPSV
jgi:hypothetical protein